MNNDKEILNEILMEAVEILAIINELIKKEPMINVDYNGVYEDLKWNKIILRNRLDDLDSAETRWRTAHKYMEKLNEEE